MRCLANAVFEASFAAFRGEGEPELRTLTYRDHLLALARPAGLKQNAICELWPQRGHRGARQNAQLEKGSSKIYGFGWIFGFLPVLPIISDQHFCMVFRGDGS